MHFILFFFNPLFSFVDQIFFQSLLHGQREIKKQIWNRVSAVSGTTSISMADDEVIDPKKHLEESCKPKCVKPLIEYGGCLKRIDGDDTGSKHCTGQYFDYLSSVGKCVAPKLFSKLK